MPKSTYTRKQAFLDGIKLWRDCAITGNKEQSAIQLGLGHLLNRCPACKFNEQHKKSYCDENCIFSKVWEETLSFGCMSPRSLYQQFRQGDLGAATRIADILEQEFERRWKAS